MQNTISKFTKIKNETKICPIKVPKTKNLFKEAYWEEREGTNNPLCKPSAEVRKRVAVGHLNLLVQIDYTLFL